jgi:hypothetical protein
MAHPWLCLTSHKTEKIKTLRENFLYWHSDEEDTALPSGTP